MDEIEQAKKRIKGVKKTHKYISRIITNFLLVIIFVLISLIFTNQSDNFKSLYRKYFFEDNFSFAKFNNWYQTHFGTPIPSKGAEVMAQGTKNIFSNPEKYYDGAKFKIGEKTTITNLKSGIVVYIGNKDNYGNTVVIQGTDGYNIWYGNLENINVSLYSYIDANTILGNTVTDEFYLVINKDNKFIAYADYQN